MRAAARPDGNKPREDPPRSLVPVTTGAMDSNWAMAKSLAMTHSPLTNRLLKNSPGRP
jgi:hypothetical protein